MKIFYITIYWEGDRNCALRMEPVTKGVLSITSKARRDGHGVKIEVYEATLDHKFTKEFGPLYPTS